MTVSFHATCQCASSICHYIRVTVNHLPAKGELKTSRGQPRSRSLHRMDALILDLHCPMKEKYTCIPTKIPTLNRELWIYSIDF